MGRRLVNGKERTKARPLKITFTELKTKREVLIRSKELRNSENPINKNLFVNPDLTEEQRKKDRELRDEMWKIRETENKNVAIKKGKIVEVPYNVRKTRQATPKPSNVANTPNAPTDSSNNTHTS